mgnify:CR=1 FL=1
MSLLHDDDRKAIAEHIGRVEATTAAEIVVLTVEQSDAYRDARALLGAFCALTLAMVAHVLFPELSFSQLACVQLAAFALGWLLSGLPAVLRVIVPRARVAQSVLARAEREFLEHGIFETRRRAGVLILVSELEHHVVILGDRGIHEHVHVEGWEQHVAHIVQAIKQGRAASGISDVIDALGATLASVLPRGADDRNELDDTVKRS